MSTNEKSNFSINSVRARNGYFCAFNGSSVTHSFKDNTRMSTVKPPLMYAPQKFVIPKEKVMLCLFSFGITNFWDADIIRGDTVF